MPSCLLIDGNNIIFRAYYAFQNQRLKTSDGKPVGALYGFVRMMLKMLKERQPDLVAVAFDTSRNTFRKKLYPEYKAKRRPVPEDLLEQLPLAHKAVEALGIKIMTHEDYEADDLIGSAAKSLAEKYQINVVTGDRDLLQLIGENVLVELCQKGVTELRKVDNEEFEREYGFGPRGIIELKALMGDSSDNIPGVKGIGEKKGLALIQQFGTIEKLYASIDEVSNDKMRQKLLDDKEMAFLSHDLATIRCDVPTFASTAEMTWDEGNLNKAEFTSFLSRFEFNSLYREFAGHDLKTVSQSTSAGNSESTAAASENDPQALRTLPGERLIVNRIEDLQAFFARAGNNICLDLETDGLDPLKDKIIGVSFASDTMTSIYVPLRHAYLGLSPEDQIDSEIFFEFLKKELPGHRIIGHNLKFDLAFLNAAGVSCGTLFFDTMIAAYLIDSTRSNALKNLAREILQFDVKDYKTVAGNSGFAAVDLAQASDYACQDALLTFHLLEKFEPMLKQKKLEDLYQTLEMPLMTILMNMELFGIGLNKDYLDELTHELSGRLGQLEESIYSHAGRTFNVNSTQQLQEILFKDLGLNPPRKTKTGFSTDSEVLRILAPIHPICSDLLEYRELAKLKSTYAESLSALVNPQTGLIHASFNQTVTATGRLSSSNPNMQNIPIRTEWGRKIRRAFIPPRAGDVFLSLDYSQIELRLLAHFSRDEGLLEAYRLGTDIHALTAARIFRKEPEEINSSERNIGKTVNFGILYGISAHGLAEDLCISRPQAKEYIDSFYESFAQVTSFFNEVVEEARKTEEVETLLGRVRHLPDINSSRFQTRSGAERIAKNTRLQGSAADLVKKAMIDSARALCEEGYQTRLILQIHDELVFSVPENELKEVAPLLKRLMENCVKLNVPLVCDMCSGPNLADQDELEL